MLVKWKAGLYSPWNSPGQNTGIDSLSILQGIFPTQGLNPSLPHCRGILCQLSHKGSQCVIYVLNTFLELNEELQEKYMSVLTEASRQIKRLSKTPPHKYHIYAQITKAIVTMHWLISVTSSCCSRSVLYPIMPGEWTMKLHKTQLKPSGNGRIRKCSKQVSTVKYYLCRKYLDSVLYIHNLILSEIDIISCS